VLSRTSRLTSPADFQTVMRRGRRAGRRSLVVHLASSGEDRPPRAGFVVSRAVGGAVDRNLVRRRLRHLCRDELATLPAGSMLVVRALPGATEASYADLRADLHSGLERAATAERSGGRR
jgi:ribonuclease P protein component